MDSDAFLDAGRSPAAPHDLTEGGGPPARRRLAWLLAAGLAAGTALLYAQVAGHPFISFDDNRYLTENPVVQRGLTWRGVAWAFTTFHVSNWHPLTWLSHMADVELFGLAAGPHHLVNVALHALDAALLLLVLFRLTGALGRSAAVAALFAVHPLHVESVAWVAERKDLLSTLFGLLALLAYARHAERPRTRTLAAVAVAFAASLLAKPMWVTLPFLLLLLDLWPLRRWPVRGAATHDEIVPSSSPRRLVLEKLPLLALSIASSAITVAAQRSGGALQGLDLGLAARLGNAAVSYVRYLTKTVWPSPLAIFYPHPGNDLPAWQALGAVGILTAISAVAMMRWRRSPWLAVGWGWFLGTLVPVIGLVQVGAQAMADRYTYLPSIGLFVAIAWEAERLAGARGRRVLGGVAVAALLALSALTFRQLGHWSSHERLFRHALEVTPANGVAHGVLAEDLRRQGRLEEALAEAREAVQLAPGTPRHWNNLGVSLREAGRLPEAREALGEALRLDPSHVSSWANLALVDQDLGDLEGAEGAALRAAQLAPDDGAGWFRLGVLRARLGRLAEAVDAYQEAVRHAPEHFGAWTNLAVLYQASGRTAEAGAAFEAATRAEPGNRLGWRNLGVFLANTGRIREAIPAFEEALRLGPDDPDVGSRLDLARAAAGDR